MRVLSWLVTGILLLFTVRRWLLLVATLLPARTQAKRQVADCPTVLVLVPVRNEMAILPTFLAALDALDYPIARFKGILIDDGSIDGSQGMLREWAEARRQRSVFTQHPHRWPATGDSTCAGRGASTTLPACTWGKLSPSSGCPTRSGWNCSSLRSAISIEWQP